jgi:hypothetical protein
MEKSKIAIVGTLGKNCLGTADINIKMPGARKEESYCVYPMSKGSDWTKIHIQSGKRFAELNLLTGKGIVSKPANYSSHAGLMADKIFGRATEFEIASADLERIKEHIKTTSGASVGNHGVSCDNTEASMTSL